MSFSAEGDRPGEYPSEAFDALDKAVEAAESLMDSPGHSNRLMMPIMIWYKQSKLSKMLRFRRASMPRF